VARSTETAAVCKVVASAPRADGDDVVSVIARLASYAAHSAVGISGQDGSAPGAMTAAVAALASGTASAITLPGMGRAVSRLHQRCATGNQAGTKHGYESIALLAAAKAYLSVSSLRMSDSTSATPNRAIRRAQYARCRQYWEQYRWRPRAANSLLQTGHARFKVLPVTF
jgi:hypothetical protein